MPIDIRSPLHPNWMRVHPPSVQCPYWHEEDGTRHSFSELAAGQDEQFVARLIDLHAHAVWELIVQSKGAAPARLRALAHAAGRLGEEIGGLWPKPPAAEQRPSARSGADCKASGNPRSTEGVRG